LTVRRVIAKLTHLKLVRGWRKWFGSMKAWRLLNKCEVMHQELLEAKEKHKSESEEFSLVVKNANEEVEKWKHTANDAQDISTARAEEIRDMCKDMSEMELLVTQREVPNLS